MIRVGKNAQDNWDLVRNAKQHDLWFHVKSSPSAHVILDQNFITPENIKECALLAKTHSKLKTLSSVNVIYCEVSNIRKGVEVGEVHIKNNKKCKVIKI